MIAEMPALLPSARLISLDHDLDPEGPAAADPGTGWDVVKVLAALPPVCPVILHTSNRERATWMQGELDLGRWRHHRVAPLGDDWIERDWRRVARRLLKRRVLFVCEGNLHRGPTAERLYASTPGIEARSAGLSGLARVQLTAELLAWADVVFVMERRLVRLIRRRFTAALAGTDLVCLNVPDEFQLMQPELQALLIDRLAPHLGQPARGCRLPDDGNRTDP
jgi:predicted protein tyrosine phosphatase